MTKLKVVLKPKFLNESVLSNLDKVKWFAGLGKR